MTSGLTWRAFYMGTLSPDEKTMHLEGYVRVTNNSGGDYENAQTRLIVGKVHILDQIAELAQRQHPYGRPGEGIPMPRRESGGMSRARGAVMDEMMVVGQTLAEAPKQIVKEGLSEYFLYTIEGTETIPTGWSKRLKSFDIDGVPVVNLYKFEEERHGPRVVRFLSFTNDEEHELGETPIPDGSMRVYRSVGDRGHLSYEGQSSFKYIPVGEEVELNLGAVPDVVVEPILMDFETENYRFDDDGNVSGWDDVHTIRIDARNMRDVPVKVEVRRNFDTQYWSLSRSGAVEQFEKVDLDTVEFTVEMAPRSARTFEYTVRLYRQQRIGDWRAN
jgi:hypothetical protein